MPSNFVCVSIQNEFSSCERWESWGLPRKKAQRKRFKFRYLFTGSTDRETLYSSSVSGRESPQQISGEGNKGTFQVQFEQICSATSTWFVNRILTHRCCGFLGLFSDPEKRSCHKENSFSHQIPENGKSGWVYQSTWGVAVVNHFTVSTLSFSFDLERAIHH